MRILPPAFKTELESQEFVQAILISMDIVETTLNITSWTAPIVYDSIIYRPRGLKLSPLNYSSATIVDNLSVEIDDTDRGIYTALGEHDSGEYPITFRWIVLDSLGKILASLIIFSGTIDQWDYEPGKVTIIAASIFNRWSQGTLSRYSESCRWKVFKGVECKYVGDEPTCSRTYDFCSNLKVVGSETGNSDNFGGFRWTAGLVNKKLGGI